MHCVFLLLCSALEGDGSNFVVLRAEVHLQVLLNVFGQFVKVLAIRLGEDEGGDAGPARCDRLLLHSPALMLMSGPAVLKPHTQYEELCQ